MYPKEGKGLRNRAWVALVVTLVVTMMIAGSLVTVFPTAGRNGTSLAMKGPGPTPQVDSSARTVIIEVFTGTWCPPCANADPSISRIADEYSSNDLLVLMYHLSSPDPYINTASNTRASFYNIAYVPTAIVDGGGAYVDDTLWVIGAWPQKSQNYDNYRVLIDSEPPTRAPVSIALATDLHPNSADVVATIRATDPITVANLTARFVLYEDALYYMGSNGAPYHRAVVRDLQQQPFSISTGQTVTLPASFALQGAWNRNKLGVGLMVQTNDRTAFTITVSGAPYTGYDARVLNSARADFVPPGITVYRDEPLTDYQESYEKLLSDGARHFSTFDVLSPSDRGVTDVRGPPTAADLAARPMVVWFTGSQPVGGTLDAAERALLQDYVTNTNGNLLIAGENIGADIGTTAFYQNVLQANFVADVSGGTMIQGVAGDPVSNAWASSSLTFGGGSPDAINARNLAVVAFTYQGTGQGAAIRSDFDSNSRVLYFGANFLEGTDPARRDVLGSAVRWFDAKSPPVVGVQFPNGGETLNPGTSYKLTWSAKDVEIPANAVDIYFTADSSNPSWTLIASGEPNDGVYWWTPPSGIDSPLCLLKVVARDGQGNSGQDLSNADFTIGSPSVTPFQVVLQPGLNLVSFPVTPIGNGLTSVLSTVDPWYSSVWTFDSTTGTWVTWHRGGSSNGLQTLDQTMGFWIDVTSSSAVTLTINGVAPAQTSIALASGWNLVGFPSSRTGVTVGAVKAATGATAVVGYGPDGPGYTRTMADTESLAAGKGYYIYVTTPTVWVVAY